jgi:cell division protein FtsB
MFCGRNHVLALMRPPVAEPGLKRARKFQPTPVRPPIAPRIVRYVLMVLALAIIIDGLFGDRGLVDTMKARQDYAALERHVGRLKEENAALREEARRLKEDPAAIEAIAREELGLIYPGETLFIVKDRTVRTAR